MQTLSSFELLALWERGVGLSSLDQGLLALSAFLPGVPPETLADWPLGRRNRALVELQCACFQPQLQAWAACSNCGEKMEFHLDARELVSGKAGDQQEPREAVVNGRAFRLPTSRDLAQVMSQGSSREAAISIVERCCMDQGEPHAWSESQLEQIGDALAAADPSAEIRISLCCPGCGREWDESLDLVAFLWAEIDARTKRLFWDIHALASTYGWNEPEILSLSETRRSFYVDMVRA